MSIILIFLSECIEDSHCTEAGDDPDKGTCNTDTNMCECSPGLVPLGEECVGKLQLLI